jgi:protein dithiol oxidoreductase (disulfide-forming)
MQRTSRLLFLILAAFTFTASAQPRESVEGVHYFALPMEVPTGLESDKIEVREVFWYGCQECSTLEPMLTEWRDGVTGDLVFARMPAVWNDLMALHARIYYTGRAVEAEDRINQAAYRAIHEQHNPLRTEEQIKAFFAENGVDAAAFDTAWNSEDVTNAVQEARLRTVDYTVDKVPSIILNGRYKVVHNAKVTDHVELNIAVNNVIRTLRDERRSDF